MTDHPNPPLSTADIARGTTPTKAPDRIDGQTADRQAAETTVSNGTRPHNEVTEADTTSGRGQGVQAKLG